jgi:hypothetical protein
MKYDNMSLDGKVGFIESGHKYTMIGDKDFKFNSVTTLIKDYYNAFDASAQAKKSSKDPNSKYFGKDPEEIERSWKEYAELKSSEGTILHAYGQQLLDYHGLKKGGKMPKAPNLPKARHVPVIVNKLFETHKLAKTEILLYSKDLALAGQSDILLKHKDIDDWYAIYDWKFLSKPLEKTSYYNPYKRSYKKMTGIFKHLKDCNWIHYSIQLALYQTLTGAPGKIREKVLVVVYDDDWEFVPAYPMRVFWDDERKMHAIYEIWNGKIYDSRVDKLLRTWPKDIVGR